MLSRLKFEIAPLINEILDQLPAEVWTSETTTFLDPAIGGGQFIRAIEQRLRAAGHSDANITGRVYGCENSKLSVQYAKNKYKLVATLGVGDFLEKDFTTMKFDVVVGNPPFQGDKGEGTRAEQLFAKFVYKSLTLTDNLYLVLPSLWTHKPNKLKKAMVESGLKKVVACSSHFKSIGIPTCYVVINSEESDNIMVTSESGFESTVTKNVEAQFNLNSESGMADNIINKAKISSDNLSSRWYRSSINRNSDLIGKGKIKMIDTTGKKNESLPLVSVDVNKEAFKTYNDYKVVMNNVHGDLKNFGVVKVASPGVGASYGVITLKADSKIEAENLKNYLNSKVILFIVSRVKNAPPNSKQLFKNIPEVDFTRSWTDAELYAHFKLTQAEIDYIEANVK